jgi:Ca2+-binding RTX toxin-like protein
MKKGTWRRVAPLTLAIAGAAMAATGTAVAHPGGNPPLCLGRPATDWLETPGRLVGTNGPDVLVGSDGDDIIEGRGGDDVICTYDGNDRVYGGAGNDVIDADPEPLPLAFSEVWGGPGNDRIYGPVNAWGGTGDDTIEANRGNIYGEAGNDQLYLFNGESAYGGAGHDIVRVEVSDMADGGSGNDHVSGRWMPDALKGGSGNDIIVVGEEGEVAAVEGGSGIDQCTTRGVPFSGCEVVN